MVVLIVNSTQTYVIYLSKSLREANRRSLATWSTAGGEYRRGVEALAAPHWDHGDSSCRLTFSVRHFFILSLAGPGSPPYSPRPWLSLFLRCSPSSSELCFKSTCSLQYPPLLRVGLRFVTLRAFAARGPNVVYFSCSCNRTSFSSRWLLVIRARHRSLKFCSSLSDFLL